MLFNSITVNFIGELIATLFILGSIGYINYNLALQKGNRLLDLMDVPRLTNKIKHPFN